MFLKTVAGHVPHITSITSFELYLGHIKMKKKENLDDFINQFHLLPFDSAAAKAAAKYRLSWMKKE